MSVNLFLFPTDFHFLIKFDDQHCFLPVAFFLKNRSQTLKQPLSHRERGYGNYGIVII